MKARLHRKARTPEQLAQPGRDLFGEVPVSFEDVYAWLLAVANIDPESERAAAYVRDWGVVRRIVECKLKGTMESIVDAARRNPRYVELTVQGIEPGPRRNPYGVNEWREVLVQPPKKRAPLWRHRSAQEVAHAKSELRRQRALNKLEDRSMLRRLPQQLPPFAMMLDDIGNPSAGHLAKAMGVSETTARRWIAEGSAPQSVQLAVFWVTRWGASAADTNAYNDALHHAQEARILRRQLQDLQSQLAQLEQIADFGAANDPSPIIAAMLASPAAQPCATPLDLATPETTRPAAAAIVEVGDATPSPRLAMVDGDTHTTRREVRIIFDSIERCA